MTGIPVIHDHAGLDPCRMCVGCRLVGKPPERFAHPSVPEAREMLAGGETTGWAMRWQPHIHRALEGRERGGCWEVDFRPPEQQPARS